MICGFCEKGVLHEKVITREFERDGYVLVVPNYKVSGCDSCGAVVTSAQQARENQLAKNAAEAKRFGLLTGSDVKRIREKFRLSQADASTVFGGGPNAFYKYERSEVIVSKAMDLLLRVTDEIPEASAWLLGRAGKVKASTSVWRTECDVIFLSASKKTLRHVTKQDAEVEAANEWNDFNEDGASVAYAHG